MFSTCLVSSLPIVLKCSNNQRFSSCKLFFLKNRLFLALIEASHSEKALVFSNFLAVIPKLFLFTRITAQKMKFSTKDFLSKCDQIRRKLRIWSHLLKKSLVENFIFCPVYILVYCTFSMISYMMDYPSS